MNNMYRHHTALLAILLLMMIFTSCGSSKRITNLDLSHASLSKGDFFRVYEGYKTIDVVDGKCRLALEHKGQEVGASSGRFSLKKDEAFVLSLRLLGVEFGKMTVTKDGIAVLDRFGKRGGVFTDATEILRGQLLSYDIDPRILSAALYHVPFSRKDTGLAALKSMVFRLDSDAKKYIFEDKKGGIKHEFDYALNLTSSLLHLPDIGDLRIDYADFINLGDQIRPYPSRIGITVSPSHGGQSALSLDLENVSSRFSQNIDLSVPQGYRIMTLDELKKFLTDLSK